MKSPVCVDASVVVRLVVAADDSERVQDLVERWRSEGRILAAPALLHFGVANALYRCEQAGDLTADDVQQALDAALALKVELAGEAALHVEAVLLARRLGLKATCEAHHLVLAERIGAEFWTRTRAWFDRWKDRCPGSATSGMAGSGVAGRSSPARAGGGQGAGDSAEGSADRSPTPACQGRFPTCGTLIDVPTEFPEGPLTHFLNL